MTTERRHEEMESDWTVCVYQADDDATMIDEWVIEKMTERAASREAQEIIRNEYPHAGDWTLNVRAPRVRSRDPRDDRAALYVVKESGIAHVSGSVAKIEDERGESFYRLERLLHAVDCDMDEDCACAGYRDVTR